MESEAWKHYKKNENGDYAVCNYCQNKLSIKGSSTTGLIRHLMAKHGISIKNKNNVQVQQDNETEEHVAAKKPKLQSSIFKFVKRASLAQIISRLVAKDGISFHAIKNSSFIRQSITELGYVLPKHQSDIQKLVRDYYIEIKSHICEENNVLKNSNTKFSITTDEWTSTRNRRYMNINLHYSDGKFCNLGLARIDGACPSEKAVEMVEIRLRDFGLSFSDIVGCTSDGAAVMVKFGRLIPSYHQLCYNHGIHLAILDVLYKKPVEYLPQIDSDLSSSESQHSDESTYYEVNSIQVPNINNDINIILNRLRKIVKIFKLSPTKNFILQSKVKEKHGKELSLLLDCRTRWNTIVIMIERYLKITESVNDTLKILNIESYIIEESDIMILENLMNILKPVKLAVEAFGKEDANLLTSEGIFQFLFETLNENRSSLAKELLSALKIRFNVRRNKPIVSVIQFLQNPQILKSNIYFEELRLNSKTEILKTIKEIMIKYFHKEVNFEEEKNAAMYQ